MANPSERSLVDLLRQLEQVRQSLPRVAGTMPGGQLNPNVKKLEELRSLIESALGSTSEDTSRSVLDTCASLPDVSYWIEHYYPPAGIGGTGSEVTISFAFVRQLATEVRPRISRHASPVRDVRIFVSSTFRDLRVERELLIKQVIPRIREVCRLRFITVTAVDLRWGITEEQQERGEVLSICLQEIEQCRPFFIGILGERYGWIPDSMPPREAQLSRWFDRNQGRSATELEIIHGVLENDQMKDFAFFYFRDACYLDRFPTETKSADYQEMDDTARDKLTDLKRRIRQQSLAVRENYENPQEFARLVEQDLLEAIERRFPDAESFTESDAEDLNQEFYRQGHREFYLPPPQFSQIQEWARRDTSESILLVTGEEGLGKSAILANIKEWSSEPIGRYCDRPRILYHSCEAGTDAANRTKVLRRLNRLLSANVDQDLPRDSDDREESDPAELFSQSLRTLAVFTVFLLDGMDHGDDALGFRNFDWLPDDASSKCRFVVSARPGSTTALECQRRGCATVSLDRFPASTSTMWLTNYLRHHSKSLAADELETIAEADIGRSPLSLRLLADELIVVADHDRLRNSIGYYCSADSPSNLVHRILDRISSDEVANPGLTALCLAYVTLSRHGLSEDELRGLLANESDKFLPQLTWTTIYLTINNLLFKTNGILVPRFDCVKQAAADLYQSLGGEEELRTRIAKFFQTSATLGAVAAAGKGHIQGKGKAEVPWQYAQAQQWEELYTIVSDGAFLHFPPHDDDDLTRYWRLIYSNTDYRIADAFAERLNDPGKRPMSTSRIVRILRRLGDHEFADKLVNRTTEDSDDPIAQSGRLLASGNAFARSGDWSGALKKYRQAESAARDCDHDFLKLTVENLFSALVQQVVARAALGETERLLIEIDRLIVEIYLGAAPINDWQHATLLGVKANIYQQLNRFEEAIKVLEQQEQIWRRKN